MTTSALDRAGDGRRETVENIQALRFFAALVVLIGHAIHEAVDFGFGSVPLPAMPWAFGVDIFFVISGFVMFYVAGDQFGKPGAPRRFITARVKRVVPLYWIFTSLMILSIIMLGGVIQNTDLSLPWVAASYAFLPWARIDGVLQPVLALGWTLNYEMFFYVLFALALALPRYGLAVLLTTLLGMAASHAFIPDEAVQLKYWTNPIILEFVAGIALAAIHRSGVRLAPLPAAGFVLAALALTPAVIVAEQGWLLWGAPAFVIVAAMALTRPLPSRLGTWLSVGGASSYALYLAHPFAINVVAIIYRKAGLTSSMAFVFLACVAAIVAGLAVHFLIEKNITNLLMNRTRRRPSPSLA